VLSSARYATQRTLQAARKARQEPPPKERKRKAKESQVAKRKGKEPQVATRKATGKRQCDEDVIGAADSEVEREVDVLMQEDEEDEEDERNERMIALEKSLNGLH
jgi:hypothetical protein